MRDVAFSCDDNGTPFLKVAVYSLLAHYRGDEPLRVNVFEGWGGHSEGNKLELEKIVGEWNRRRGVHSPTQNSNFFSVRYHNVEQAVEPYADLIMNRERSRWNIFTWTPIFTPAVLSDATGNVIHFDIDMLFNADVSALFELDLSDYLIACCHEYDKYGENAGKVIWEKGILPPQAERYFNTGVLVFNAEACRAERTWEKIVAWYREHYEIADRIEQDAWNALYWDRTYPLHVKWNFHDRNIKNYAKWPLDAKYWLGNPPRECLEASLNPCILHFWGPKKPWKPSHRHYRKLYHAAMAAVGLTPPREQFLAPYYNLVNARYLAEIRPWLEVQAEHYARLPMPRAALLRRLRRRAFFKAVKQTLLTPFEWLAIGLGMLFLGLAPHRLMIGLCDVLAAVHYAFDRRGRNYALANLRLALGTADAWAATGAFDADSAVYDPTARERRLIRGSYRNMARTVGHAFWTCLLAVERVKAVGEMDPKARDFLAAHKPAVTVSGHIGCWEILSQLAYLEGHRMMSVAKRIGTVGMTRLLMKSRESIGQEIVPADGAFKPLMAGIKAGKSLGLLVDQRVDPDEGGLWVRFFGRPITVSAAPAFFAAKAKVPIIVAWSRPLPGGRYRCEKLDEISVAEAKDVWRTTQRCATDLARIIRRHPSRWVLNYNFFSNIPTAKDLATLAEREAQS